MPQVKAAAAAPRDPDENCPTWARQEACRCEILLSVLGHDGASSRGTLSVL